jgi:ABC-type enterochelin transport system permease subunit
MRPLKLVLFWHVFAVTHIAIFFLLLVCVPEEWLYRKLSERTTRFIDEDAWANIHMTGLLCLSLSANGVVIFFMTQLATRLSREWKRWHRSPKNS